MNKKDRNNKDEITEEKSLILKGSKTLGVIALLKKLLGNYKENNYVEIDDSQFPQVKVDAKMEDGSQKVLNLTSDFSYNEGIDQDFVGDFPSPTQFYQISKPYFLRVIKGSRS